MTVALGAAKLLGQLPLNPTLCAGSALPLHLVGLGMGAGAMVLGAGGSLTCCTVVLLRQHDRCLWLEEPPPVWWHGLA